MAINVETSKLREAARQMANINRKLCDKLNESQKVVNALKESYQGEAADETFANYDAFAKQYFQRYQEAIQGYVDFLNESADQIDGVEKEIVGYADALK